MRIATKSSGAAKRDIRLERNGDFEETLRFVNSDNEPIDLTEAIIVARAKRRAGDGPVLASAVITPIELDDGSFSYRFRGSDFDGYGSVYAETVTDWDMLITYPSGVRQVYLKGHIFLTPEVS